MGIRFNEMYPNGPLLVAILGATLFIWPPFFKKGGVLKGDSKRAYLYANPRKWGLPEKAIFIALTIDLFLYIIIFFLTLTFYR
jgi:hypothetical protein